MMDAHAPTKATRVEQFSAPPPGWDDFVAAKPGATFCHLAGWADVFRRALGHETSWLVAMDENNRWTGVLPLARVKSRVFGDYLLSMPFLNYGGPIGTNEAREHLVAAAVRAARDGRVDLLELRSRTPVGASLTRSDRKITVLLDLPPASDELFRRFPGKLRSQVRRPEKEGMQTRFGVDELNAFYEVFARNMRDLGTPVLPRAFFERIAAVFPGVAEYAVVYHAGRPVAAACGFLFAREFEITWASSLREWNRLSPNMLLYWALMQRAISRGAPVFNFGRCTPGGGTHRFKSQWGGRDVALPWTQWSPREVFATPSPDRPVFRIATALWSRLPLRVANTVGPVIARVLP